MATDPKAIHQAGTAPSTAGPTGAGTFPYATADAFRRALTDRLATIAEADSRYSVNQLQRHFAYDRVLARCFTAADADRWVLKGAGALLARLAQARHSRDIDLYYAEREGEADAAVEALRTTLDRDIGDHFVFEVEQVTPLIDQAKGRRVHLSVLLGRRQFAAFHVDVVVATAMSSEAETVPPLTPLQIDGLVRPSYRVFPIADHIADKLCAIVGTHQQRGRLNASSRVKDLVDIALIARSHRIRGDKLRTAIFAGAAYRALDLPSTFAVPDPAAWEAGYAKPAAAAPSPVPNYDEAVDLAKRLLDPVLAGQLAQEWDPDAREWLT